MKLLKVFKVSGGDKVIFPGGKWENWKEVIIPGTKISLAVAVDLESESVAIHKDAVLKEK